MKELKNRLLVIFLMLPYFRPRMLGEHNLFNIGYNVLFLCSLAFTLISIIRNNSSLATPKSDIYKMFVYVLLFEFWKVIVAFINGGNTSTYIKNAIMIVSLIISTIYWAKKCVKTFIWSISFIMNVCICINFLFFLFIPEGFGTDATGNVIYFWNTSKHIISLYMVAFTMNIFVTSYIYKKNKIIYTLMNILIIVDLLLEWAATALIGMGVYVIIVFGLIFSKKEKKSIYYNPWLYFGIGIGANIAIVVFRVQEIFRYLIVDVLGKNMTFTGRTYIWDLSINLIKEKWLIGYGVSDLIVYKGYKLMAHNQFLDIMIQAGCIGLIFFLLYFITIVKQLHVTREKRSTKFIIAIMFSYLIMMISERVSPFEPLYIIFTMTYFVGELEKGTYNSGTKSRGIKIKWRV